MGNSMVSQKSKCRLTIGSIHFTTKDIPKVIESRNSHWYLYTHVHKISMHNNCLDKWKAKQNVIYTSNGILLRLKKEWNSYTVHST
jgi:hypothetical protein